MTVSAAVTDSSDAELIRRFSASRDEAAFTTLVTRHAAMVWSVCRGVLRHEQDVEDAFQATFVVLALRAGSVRKAEAVGSWLYGVARRVAMKAKRDASVRRTHEQQQPGSSRSPARSEVDMRETLALVDEEVQHLSDRYRAVFVLCCLEGKSAAQAARQLGWKEGTVAVTLSRARKKLRERLASRGVTLTAALSVLALTRTAASAAPAALVHATIRAATLIAAGNQAAASSVLTAGAAALSERIIKTMLPAKINLAILLCLATGLLGTSIGLFASHYPVMGPKETADEQGDRVTAPAPQKEKAPAPVKAREFLAQAMQASAAVTDPKKKARALLVISEAQIAARDNAAALRTIQKAFAIARTLPEDRLEQIEDRFRLFSQVLEGQARAGDLAAAEKTMEALRPPKTEVKGAEDRVVTYRASALEALASAQAATGKFEEAAKTAGWIDDKFWYMRSRALLALANAQARKGDFKAARAIVARMTGESRFDGLAELARRQSEAGHAKEAHKTVAEALKAAEALTDEESRDQALSRIAYAQADVGDLPGALRTAQSCPGKQVRTISGELVSFPCKERCLVTLMCRAGDVKGARTIADTIDNEYQEGYQRAHALRVIARARAGAKDVKGALATAAAIRHEFLRPAAYIDIGQALVKAGNRAGAVAAFAKALELAQEAPEDQRAYFYLLGDDARSTLLRTLAAAQEEVGEGTSARDWIAKLKSPYVKTWALAGLVEGAHRRRRY
jgi:RNA polymerase sigma factor (sigma-70 family)